ncbi:LOW QUALITY PROTEIN: hypothetical protein YC2023_034251 [Brassica napus]
MWNVLLLQAYAAAKSNTDACLGGGDANVVECSFVASEQIKLAFFATKVRLGVEEVCISLGP